MYVSINDVVARKDEESPQRDASYSFVALFKVHPRKFVCTVYLCRHQPKPSYLFPLASLTRTWGHKDSCKLNTEVASLAAGCQSNDGMKSAGVNTVSQLGA